MGIERRGCVDQLYLVVNEQWEEPLRKAKPFHIARRVVWEAYKRVKANQGAAGVDGESIAVFERDLKEEPLQALEPDVLRELLSTAGAGGRDSERERRYTDPGHSHGRDRIAQMVAKRYLEPLVEPHFHQDSYGYRPGKSAIQAVGVARQRCWRLNWVLDLDIRGFFDNLDHALLLRAVQKHTDCRWLILIPVFPSHHPGQTSQRFPQL
jgi:RNA-directed DNA polymerase